LSEDAQNGALAPTATQAANKLKRADMTVNGTKYPLRRSQQENGKISKFSL
jgi:hypothetical protein